jgi:hypothetical protein
MLRQDFFTKEICRLLHGGKMVAVPGAAPLTGTQVEVDPVVGNDRAELLGDPPQFEN